MLFKRKPILLVQARQATSKGSVKDKLGRIRCYDKGDWIVQQENGEQGVYKDAHFRQFYEPATDDDIRHIYNITPSAARSELTQPYVENNRLVPNELGLRLGLI